MEDNPNSSQGDLGIKSVSLTSNKRWNILDTSGNLFRPLSKNNQPIKIYSYNLDFDPIHNNFAYITQTEENTGYGIGLEMRLYNITSKKEVVLKSSKPTNDHPTHDYIHPSGAVNFSDNGNLLAFVLDSKLFVYSVNEGKLKDYEFIKYGDDLSGITSLLNPVFSPSNKFIIIEIGYIESAAYVLIDRESKATKSLPYTSGFSSAELIGFLSTDELLISEQKFDPNSLELTDGPHLYSINTDGSNKQFIGDTGISSGRLIIINDIIHYATGGELFAYYINKKKSTKLLSVQDSIFNNEFSSIHQIYKTPESNILLAELYSKETNGKYYRVMIEVDLTHPTNFKKLFRKEL